MGLLCVDCVTASAASLVQISPALPGDAVARSFAQMYPDAACGPMAGKFALAYYAARPVRVATAAA